MKFDHVGGYFDNRYGGFGWSRSDLGSNPYGKRSEESPRDSIRDDGAYAYEGGKVEPYGARGTTPKSSTWAPTFDDYGRSIGIGSRNQKGFDSDFEFERHREGCPQGRNSTRREEWGPEVSGQVAARESWSEHHGCSLPGTTMSFSEWERGNERMNKKRRGWNKKLLFFFCSKLQCTSIYRCAL